MHEDGRSPGDDTPGLLFWKRLLIIGCGARDEGGAKPGQVVLPDRAGLQVVWADLPIVCYTVVTD